MSARLVACCFGSVALRQASALRDGPWNDRTDAGLWRLEPLLLGEPVPPAAAGLVLVAGEDDLAGADAQAITAIESEVAAGRLALDVVAPLAAVRTYLWLAAHAQVLVQCFHQDGEAKLAAPSWWRRRIERYLAGPPAPIAADRGSTTSILPARIRAARP